jgi:hypothetical protein
MAGLSEPITTGPCFSKKEGYFQQNSYWYQKPILLFGKQIQKQLGYNSPAICFSPDEESGAAAAVGFRIERFA